MSLYDVVGSASYGVGTQTGYPSSITDAVPKPDAQSENATPFEFSSFLPNSTTTEPTPDVVPDVKNGPNEKIDLRDKLTLIDLANVNGTGALEKQSVDQISPSTASELDIDATPLTSENTADGYQDLKNTSSELSVKGNGFLVVEDSAGASYMTQSSSFNLDENGALVDPDGNKLLGYSYSSEPAAAVVNDYSGLTPIMVPSVGVKAEGSTFGTLVANLDANAEAIETADLPSETSGENTKYTHKTSIRALNEKGDVVQYDVYFSKVGDNSWQMSIFNAAGRNPGTGGFPYTAGSLLTEPTDIEFDANGRLASPTISDATLALPASAEGGAVPDMKELTLYFSGLTQGQAEFSASSSTNGNPLSILEKLQITDDGTVWTQYTNGGLRPTYRLAVAAVESPEELTSVSKSLYAYSDEAGSVILGVPKSDGMGAIEVNTADASSISTSSELSNQGRQETNMTTTEETPAYDLINALLSVNS